MKENSKKIYNSFRKHLELSAGQKQRVWEKVFARLSEPALERPISAWLRLRQGFLKVSVLVPLVLLLFVFTTAAVSAHALPGDLLYPVKRQMEELRVLAAPSQEARLELQVKLTQKRLQELDQAEQSAAKPAVKQPVLNIQRKKETTEKRAHERQAKAEQEANHALETLQQAKKNLEHKGEQTKAENLDKVITKFTKQLKEKTLLPERTKQNREQGRGESEKQD